MDAPHFDALTRRLSLGLSRRSLGLLGILGLRGLVAPDTATAKKAKHAKKKPCPPCKKRKKGKCKGVLPDGTACAGGTCQRGSCIPTQQGAPPPPPVTPPPPPDPCPGQKRCGGACIPTQACCTTADCPAAGGYVCCDGACTTEKLETGSSCNPQSPCCSNYCTELGSTRTCAATCRGKACTVESDCCPGYPCAFGSCGGCRGTALACQTAAECCFSTCSATPSLGANRCLSRAGGPCATNFDCLSCYLKQECTVTSNGTTRAICTNGVCGCPDECCAASDCAPAETCDLDADGLNGVCTSIVGS
jgi:hypothetical protein